MSFWLIVGLVWAVVSVGTFCWFVWAAKHAPIVPNGHPEFRDRIPRRAVPETVEDWRYSEGVRLPR